MNKFLLEKAWSSMCAVVALSVRLYVERLKELEIDNPKDHDSSDKQLRDLWDDVERNIRMIEALEARCATRS